MYATPGLRTAAFQEFCRVGSGLTAHGLELGTFVSKSEVLTTRPNFQLKALISSFSPTSLICFGIHAASRDLNPGFSMPSSHSLQSQLHPTKTRHHESAAITTRPHTRLKVLFLNFAPTCSHTRATVARGLENLPPMHPGRLSQCLSMCATHLPESLRDSPHASESSQK